MEKDMITSGIDYVMEHAKEALIILAVGGGLAGAFYYYRSNKIILEQSATSDFALAFEEYQRALKEGRWEDVELASRAGYQQHASSKIGPFFNVLKAEGLHQEGNTQEALTLLSDVISHLSSGNPFYYLFAMKEALMRLSLSSEEQKGLEDLKQLAYEKKNKQRDQALYYLGLYYRNHNKRTEAEKIWKELVDEFTQLKIGSSPWAMLAEEKMKQG